MKRCRVCGEEKLDRLWLAAGGRHERGLCFLCSQERMMKDNYETHGCMKTPLESCEGCGEISAGVRLTTKGWFCGECER